MFLKLCIGLCMLGCMQNIVNSASSFLTNTTVNGKTYYVALDRVNFFQAFIDCEQSGMFLANVITTAEEDALDALLLDVPKDGSVTDGFWLSGTNLADTGSTRYYWLSGGEKVVFSNWLSGQPNATHSSYCISWVELKNNVGWSSYNCTKVLRYVCQKTSK